MKGVIRRIKDEESLKGRQIHLLCLAGSRAYGTDVDSSDIDIRGFCSNSAKDTLGLTQSSFSIKEGELDVVLYSLKHIFYLLMRQNPNTLEILGCRNKNYIFMDYTGKELIRNRRLFITKNVYNTFGKYVDDQISKVKHDIRDRNKVAKNLMHLVRLLYTGEQLLRTGDIKTYRDKERHQLLWIRSGAGLKGNNSIKPELQKIIDNARKDMDRAMRTTKLPEELDYDKIANLYKELNYYK